MKLFNLHRDAITKILNSIDYLTNEDLQNIYNINFKTIELVNQPIFFFLDESELEIPEVGRLFYSAIQQKVGPIITNRYVINNIFAIISFKMKLPLVFISLILFNIYIFFD